MEELNNYNHQERNDEPCIKPNNNFVWGIICTIMCCLPLGIISIICSSRVDSLWESGAYSQAIEEASKAKKYAIWGMILGIVLSILFIVFYLILTCIAFAPYMFNNNL